MRKSACVIASAVALGIAAPLWAGSDCPEDIDGDGIIGFPDLLAVLGKWGVCPGCPEDIDGDGIVGFDDLLEILAGWGPCDPTGREIAGNAVSEYPFFKFDQGFVEGLRLDAAIDPAHFVTATPCDIYVTAAKTAMEWAIDPSLTDVRGAPQTETFTTSTIQANTFELTDSNMLEGDGGASGFGVDYDLVCDCNQNGTLDGADFIDGFGDEAGFTVIRHTTLSGPLAVTEINYNVPDWDGVLGYEGENTFYPTSIGSMGQLPLVVVSRGNGHNHNWYDHIGFHLASYGYVVMSHNNHTEPGIDTAAVTTLQHTDKFIEQLPNIASGVMDGHVDTDNIVWIGHSRGGEGVARAYDRIVDGSWTPINYTLDSLRLVVSLCPTYFSPGSADTHEANFHLFYTPADADVSGSPSSGSSKPLAILEKADGNKALTYVHGAGHGDFHNGSGSSVQSGPDPIGRPATHTVLLGHLLPLVKLYVEGHEPARDYLTRMWDDFRTIGTPGNVVVAREYRAALAVDRFVLDDYQTQTSTSVSSSGGAVTFDVEMVAEGRLIDTDSSFVWSPAVPFNGFTRSRFSSAIDMARGVVFQWPLGSMRFYELEVPMSERDFSDDVFLSFRAAQLTRHPNTDAHDDRMSFGVVLRDGSGTSSSMVFGTYAGRITRTYLRTGWGIGAGWCNEFGTVRIRLEDFTHNGSGLDLTDVAAVRFEFGVSADSAQGAIGLDDIEITKN
jgi:hypothetical protein